MSEQPVEVRRASLAFPCSSTSRSSASSSAARRLYERLGYADWGHGTIVGTCHDLHLTAPLHFQLHHRDPSV